MICQVIIHIGSERHLNDSSGESHIGSEGHLNDLSGDKPHWF